MRSVAVTTPTNSRSLTTGAPLTWRAASSSMASRMVVSGVTVTTSVVMMSRSCSMVHLQSRSMVDAALKEWWLAGRVYSVGGSSRCLSVIVLTAAHEAARVSTTND